MDRVIHEVETCTAEIEVGKTYRGIVRGVKNLVPLWSACRRNGPFRTADFRVVKTKIFANWVMK